MISDLILLVGLQFQTSWNRFWRMKLSRKLLNIIVLGLFGAMLIAAYDYWGYYNVCFLGDEIKDPGRNIPRALLLSILAVAGLYVVMNISILGVIPW